jgi:guanine deaminase
MGEPSDQSRREFLSLGAAAGAALLADVATSKTASSTTPSTIRPPSAMSPGKAWAVRGKILQVPEPDHLESLPDALIVIGPDGVIERVDAGNGDSAASFRKSGRLLELGPSQYLLPGMIDTHIHAPQWPQMGTALDLPLEKWLIEYTFKLEARYSDTDFARKVYTDMVTTLLANGTTTGVYYSSIHLPATQILAELCLGKGQRAFIGRVAMDDPKTCPDGYRDKSAAIAIHETRAFIDFVKSMPGNERKLIEPVITPRFIPACTDELLTGLGKVAGETGCAVQTHCSETDWEHDYVLKRTGRHDAVAIKDFGLMNRRTVLAHGCHVSAEDRALIRQYGAAIAHCPLSNAFGSNGVLPVKTCLEEGVHVALGTDIAGGPRPSMFDVTAMATTFSKLLEDGVDPSKSPETRGTPGARISFVTAFYLATTAGGIALDLPIGLLKPGYRFDALLVDTAVPDTDLRLYDHDNQVDILQKIIWDTSRPNIKKVWVDGRLVKG